MVNNVLQLAVSNCSCFISVIVVVVVIMTVHKYCRMTNYELFRWLIKKSSHNVEHYRMINLSRSTGSHYTHTHPFNSPLSRTIRVSQYQKGKPIWILLKQETVSGSGISRAICKSASHSRQITMPAPHHSVFTGRMPFLPPNQQHQSTEGTGKL